MGALKQHLFLIGVLSRRLGIHGLNRPKQASELFMGGIAGLSDGKDTTPNAQSTGKISYSGSFKIPSRVVCGDMSNLNEYGLINT